MSLSQLRQNVEPRTRPRPTPPPPAQRAPEPEPVESPEARDRRVDETNYRIRVEALERDERNARVERAELAEMRERLQLDSGARAAEIAADLGRDADRAMLSKNPAAVAQAIANAAAKATAGANNVPLPADPRARAIVLAYQKALGLIDDERDMPPVGSVAWKILQAGRRARGEA
jgi:hypothetical protein